MSLNNRRWERAATIMGLFFGLAIVSVLIPLDNTHAKSFLDKMREELAPRITERFGGDHREAVKKLTNGCDNGNAADCYDLGLLYHTGFGVPLDLRRARIELDRGCNRGHLKSCSEVGSMLLFGRGDVKPDKAGAVAAIERACTDESFELCYPLAYAYGRDTEKALRKVVPVYSEACDRGEWLACALLADLLQLVDRLQYADQTESLYERACDGGVAAACSSLAYIVWSKPSFDGRTSRFIGLYMRSCDLGEMGGCATLAEHYTGLRKGTPVDLEQARNLRRRACDGGMFSECVELVKNETGVADADEDRQDALSVLQNACTDRQESACRHLGHIHEFGDGVLPDAKLAATLYRRACDIAEEYEEGLRNEPFRCHALEMLKLRLRGQ